MAISTSLSVGGPLVVDGGYNYARLEHRLNSGHSGVAFTSGGYRTVPFNTEVIDNDGIVSLAANQFTLGAGKYRIKFIGMSSTTDQIPIYYRLFNTSDSSILSIQPQKEIGGQDSLAASTSPLDFESTIELSSSATIEVQIVLGAGRTFGKTANSGSNESVFVLEIFKSKDLTSTVTINHGTGTSSGILKYATLQYKLPSGQAGVNLAGGNYRTLTLNTEATDPDNIVNFNSSNSSFVLTQGKYNLKTLLSTQNNQYGVIAVRLYNVTSATEVVRLHMGEYPNANVIYKTSHAASGQIIGSFDISGISANGTDSYRIEVYPASDGITPLALSASGVEELYHQLLITKYA
jgi:hypothetical protein